MQQNQIIMQSLLLKTQSVKHIHSTTNITAKELINQFNIKSPTHTQINLQPNRSQSTKNVSSNKSLKRFFEAKNKETPVFELKQLSVKSPKHFNYASNKDRVINSDIPKDSLTQVARTVTKKNNNMKSHLVLPITAIVNKQNIQRNKLYQHKTINCKEIIMSKAKFSLEQTSQIQLVPKKRKEICGRKNSTASTDVRSKHGLSLQFFEEQSQTLFQTRVTSHSHVLQKQSKPKNLAKLLQQTKKKLYQQIYSLDSKLSDDFEFAGEAKKQIVISLKKKKENSGYTQKKNE